MALLDCLDTRTTDEKGCEAMTNTEREPVEYDDVVLLSRWMADQGSTADEVACAVEKPWNYGDELERAKAGLPALD